MKKKSKNPDTSQVVLSAFPGEEAGTNPIGNPDFAGIQNDSCFPSLGFKQRLMGFVGVAILGGVLGGIGIYFLFVQQYVEFGIFYTLASLCTLFSTMFFVGPLKQLKRMIKPHRAIASAVWILTMILTIVFAIVGIPIAVVFCVIVQFVAFIWYSLTYMPFVRRLGPKIAHAICGC